MKDELKIVKKENQNKFLSANNVEIYINGKVLDHVLQVNLDLTCSNYFLVEIVRNGIDFKPLSEFMYNKNIVSTKQTVSSNSFECGGTLP